MRPGRLIAISITGMLALGACGGADESPTAAGQAQISAPAPTAVSTAAGTPGTTPAAPVAGSPTAPAQPAATAAGTPAVQAPEALRFTAPLVGGGTLDMASLAGAPVLMWFWAPY